MNNLILVLILVFLLIIAGLFIFKLYKKNIFLRKKLTLKTIIFNENNNKNELLHNSSDSYHTLVSNTSDIIFFQDTNTNFTYVTPSCELISGFTTDELLGHSVFDFFHASDVAKMRKTYFSLINDSHMKPIEFRFLKKDGSCFWVEGVSSILNDENNKLVGIITSIREIDERKKSEAEVLKYRARIDALLKNSSDAIWSIDKNFRLISFNNSFYESLKLFYDTSAYIGMPVLDHLNTSNKAKWNEYYNNALKGEHFTAEIIESGLGLELCFEVSFNPIFINSKITGVAVFSRDITSRKSIENQLEYKINELNTFIYKASHDLRSPLVSVIGLVELAKNEKTTAGLMEYVEMIGSSVVKMDNLLIDLVKIVNVAQGKLSNDKIEFDWMIEEILKSLAYRPGFAEIIFRKHLNIDADYFGDSGLIYSILQNIIDNSIKYKKNESLIEHIVIITIDVNPSQAKVSVTDNGIGIQEELIDKVFDMFYRGTSQSSGTGLGLYIVKTSVEKMGGKIALSSISGKGTNVNIVIPNKASN